MEKRPIKFRAWDKNWKQFRDDVWVRDGFAMVNGYHAEDDWTPPEYPEVILSQFTGLLDKNGKEIYEGDIIEHCQYKFAVKPITPCDRTAYWDDNETDDWMSMSDVDWEIIGNIYENPELI